MVENLAARVFVMGIINASISTEMWNQCGQLEIKLAHGIQNGEAAKLILKVELWSIRLGIRILITLNANTFFVTDWLWKRLLEDTFCLLKLCITKTELLTMIG